MTRLRAADRRGADTRSVASNNSICDAARCTGILDKRYYSTTREGGAESLQDLSETAGSPKYLPDILGIRLFFVPVFGLLTVRQGAGIPITGRKISDNTQPSARMGRKASRISLRQPGCRNIYGYSGARLFCASHMKLKGGGRVGLR
jgi:hypothetical protein